jgi:hypothetical protein
VRRASQVTRRQYCLVVITILLLALLLTACSRGGNGDQAGLPIGWTPIMPTLGPPTATVPVPTVEPTATAEPSVQATESEETPGDTAPAEDTPVETSTAPEGAGGPTSRLTAEQLAQIKPNELGAIPVFEYHDITTDDTKDDQFNRPVSKFKEDLQWLYDHNFFIIPMRDLITNSINAPAGKHPAVLTFDDSSAGQFRYINNDDGTTTIDPDSAVAILEEFFAAHPDFGRGGFFAVLPNNCFDWQGNRIIEDQTPHCRQKLQWLLDHGYEIGNHTFDHEHLLDVDNDTFKRQIGEAIIALQAMVPEIQADILNVPFGEYPDSAKHPQQWQWLREGFDYQGKQIKIIGAVTLGSQPSYAPVSTNFDPMFIYRIPTCTCDGGTSTWFPQFEAQPELLYTSDGNSNTITIPTEPPGTLVGTFDEAKAAGKEIIRY